MESDSSITLLISLLLLLGNAFFVAAEYGLVGVRRSKVESLAKQGNKTAKLVIKALDDMSTYIAGIQIGITIFGIALGALAEPFLSTWITGLLTRVPDSVASIIAIVIVSYPMVVIGELVPKYFTLKYADRVALMCIRPLKVIIPVIKPLIWVFRGTGSAVLKAMRIDMAQQSESLSREELAVLVQTGQSEGHFDETQADLITKTLKFDTLDAEDIMIHRLDIQWLEIETPKSELPEKIAKIPHSRIPVCRGDIDEVEGIVYVQDILARWDEPDFRLDRIMRDAEFIPETLTLDRMVSLMRDVKTQILIVRDEYGGTSGLITLEDIVEEIFGDLEDRLESERPSIERTSSIRVTAKASVRYDELLDFLKIDDHSDNGITTETLASLVMDGLGRVPKLGDSVELPIGKLQVENMAQSRITRLAVYLKPQPKPGDDEEE